ncbi:MAG: hypothetical protein KC635_10835, partial [Myxococcales bacterium]|nr:hypothetical protein [Myxococcales bacterium]
MSVSSSPRAARLLALACAALAALAAPACGGDGAKPAISCTTVMDCDNGFVCGPELTCVAGSLSPGQCRSAGDCLPLVGVACEDTAPTCASGQCTYQTACLTLSGTLDGLNGGEVKVSDGEVELTLTEDGAFTFDALYAVGDAYHLTITAAPTLPDQECLLYGGDGTFDRDDVASPVIFCRAVPDDGDGDRICDPKTSPSGACTATDDNCPGVFNPDQADRD